MSLTEDIRVKLADLDAQMDRERTAFQTRMAQLKQLQGSYQDLLKGLTPAHEVSIASAVNLGLLKPS